MRSGLLILDFKEGKLWDPGKQEEGWMFHRFQLLGMNDDLWDRVYGFGSDKPLGNRHNILDFFRTISMIMFLKDAKICH